MKKWLVVSVMGLLMSTVIGCSNNGSNDAKDRKDTESTVQEFLTAIQKGDVAKASTFVESEGGDFSLDKMNETVNGINGKDMFSAVTKNYTFKEPVEVSSTDEKAEIKVEVTSVDVSAALKKTIANTVSTALAEKMVGGGEEPSKKDMEKKMVEKLLATLSDKDSTMVTREVTLNVKKGKEGNHKITPDEQLAEALIANAVELNKTLNK